MNRSLGRLPEPRSTQLTLRWAIGTPPPAPASVDHLSGWAFDMGGNDRFGSCGPTSLSNHLDLTTAYLSGHEANPTDTDVFDLYRRSGNPLFDPSKPPGSPGDGGVIMSVMLRAATQFGLAGHKPLGFALLGDKSDASVQAAVSEFGGVLFGLTLQHAQYDTDTPVWDYVNGSGDVGGHAVLVGGYDGGLYRAVSWSRRYAITPAFVTNGVSEIWVPLWPELVASQKFFAAGLDLTALKTDFRSLTGQNFPPVPNLIVVDLTKKCATDVPLGWAAGQMPSFYPAFCGLPRGDFVIAPNVKRVLTPEPYQLRFGAAGYAKVAINVDDKVCFAPPGWTLGAGSGYVPVAESPGISPTALTNVVAVSGTQRIVMLAGSMGWWSSVK